MVFHLAAVLNVMIDTAFLVCLLNMYLEAVDI